MGQYYKAVLLDEKGKILKSLSPLRYSNGMKLMEHSWIGNDFMCAVENEIHKVKRVNLVWAGDYADEENGTNDTLYNLSNNFEYDMADPENHNYRFIINHTTKEYIDKRHLKVNRDGWYIHPLSLMTAIGNGRGGGDYGGDADYNLVGKWAKNNISLVKRVSDYRKKGYKELVVKFSGY